jgi:hypothetical protein
VTPPADILDSVIGGRLAADEAALLIGQRLSDSGYSAQLVNAIAGRLDDASSRALVGYLAAITAEDHGLWFAPLVASAGFHDWSLIDGFVTGLQRFLSGGGEVGVADRPNIMTLLERAVELGPVESVHSAVDCVAALSDSGQDSDGSVRARMTRLLESRVLELSELTQSVRSRRNT